MLVQFVTDDQFVWDGFRANFQYIPIEPNCANWLNMTAHFLRSPDYSTINCTWLLTAPSIDSTIIIHFEAFEVELQLILDLPLHKKTFRNILAWEC